MEGVGVKKRSRYRCFLEEIDLLGGFKEVA
jgi:hypothetical protein